MKISKTCRFEAAHRLPFHKGGCSNIHGHSYKLEVTVETDKENCQNGMVLDFKAVKQIVKDVIFDGTLRGEKTVPLDHAIILHEQDPILEVFEKNEKLSALRTFVMIEVPTAENMAYIIAGLLSIQLDYVLGVTATDRWVSVVGIKLWETEDSCATWSAYEN